MDTSTFHQRLGPSYLILFAILLTPNVTYLTQSTRVSNFIVILIHSVTTLRSHQISNPILSYFIGFGAVFTVIHSAVLIVISHPQRDFKRVRVVQHPGNEATTYEWENFPENGWWRRIWWVLDLMFNLRGIGWNFCKQPTSIPYAVLQLYKSDSRTEAHVKNSRPFVPKESSTKSSWLLNQSARFLGLYLLLDLTTIFMRIDPWLNGSGPYNPFALPAPERSIWFLLIGFRIFLVAVGAFGFIDIGITALSLLCVGILGEKRVGSWAEQWMWPGLWGSVWEIWDHGLIGLWGKFWHPLLKYPFTTFARAVIPSTLSSSSAESSNASNIKRLLRLHLIFALSGLLHATGSFTQNQKTYPLMQFAAMFLQASGIVVQLLIEKKLGEWGVSEGKRKIVVLGWVLLWATPTACMITGDVARSGMFEVKILPVSVIELLENKMRWMKT